jgi:RNA polymerase sigma-70 factor, ECF subfamily
VSTKSEGSFGVIHQAGRAAWPGLHVELDDLKAFVRSTGAQTGDLERLHAADIYLACACSKGDPPALAAFEANYMVQVPSFLLGKGSPSFVDEVAQQLRERLLVSQPGRPAQIGAYSGRGSLGSWLRIAALRTAANLRRHDRAENAAGTAAADVQLPRSDAELTLIKARYRSAFEAALSDALSALDTERRVLLRLHFLDGLSIDRLGAMFGIHRATAARRLAAAREALLLTTKKRVRERLRIGHRDLESLMGLVRSQLDVSLHDLFKAAS